ncbi:MAG: rhodanese-like domain-containing protein [Casimicrobiaceae bacterium]
MAQIAPAELAAWRADTSRSAPAVVDVRETWEYALCSIEGSLSVPLGQLPARLGELPAERDLVLVCHHGGRSQNAAMWLAQNGFPSVHNLRGGVEAWALEVDPAMPRY